MQHVSKFRNIQLGYHLLAYLLITANVRVYDHLRFQSDSVSRYSRIEQSDIDRNALPSN
jgi:hypothetical protein